MKHGRTGEQRCSFCRRSHDEVDRLIAGPDRNLRLKLLGTVLVIWLFGLLWVFGSLNTDELVVSADVYTRYSLAIPGAALVAWGLILQQRKFIQTGMKNFARDVTIAAFAFGCYGGIGQLFVSASPVFPSFYLNAEAFTQWTGMPIQLFRSLMACIAAVSIIRSMRSFEEETNRQIETLRVAQQAERERLENLRAELLRRTVRAQESERQRIARELHDEIGQTLTAIGLGLRAIAGSTSRPERVMQQAHELQTLVDGGFTGLQNLISGLHPPQLDDFGLMATLRWYVGEVRERYHLSVELTSQGDEPDLPMDLRIVLYRIIQEALTNVIRHAKTERVKVEITFNQANVGIRIDDNGCGFDVDAVLNKPGYPCWGLLGMIERAALVGGTCQITSEYGAGTLVDVVIPLAQGETHV